MYLEILGLIFQSARFSGGAFSCEVKSNTEATPDEKAWWTVSADGQVTLCLLLTSCARWHQTLCPATA